MKAAGIVKVVHDFEIQDTTNLNTDNQTEQKRADPCNLINQLIIIAQKLLADKKIFTGEKNENNEVLSISNFQHLCIRINNKQQNIAIRFDDSGLIRLELISRDNSPNKIMDYSISKEGYVLREDGSELCETLQGALQTLVKESGEFSMPNTEAVCVKEDKSIDMGHLATLSSKLVSA